MFQFTETLDDARTGDVIETRIRRFHTRGQMVAHFAARVEKFAVQKGWACIVASANHMEFQDRDIPDICVTLVVEEDPTTN